MLLSELAVNQLKNLPQQNSPLVRVSLWWAVYWTSSMSLYPFPWQKNVGLEGTAFQFPFAAALASGFTNKETFKLLPVAGEPSLVVPGAVGDQKMV